MKPGPVALVQCPGLPLECLLGPRFPFSSVCRSQVAFPSGNCPGPPHFPLGLDLRVEVTGRGRPVKSPALSSVPSSEQWRGREEADADWDRGYAPGPESRALTTHTCLSALCARALWSCVHTACSLSAAQSGGRGPGGDTAPRAPPNVTGQGGKCLDAKSKTKPENPWCPVASSPALKQVFPQLTEEPYGIRGLVCNLLAFITGGDIAMIAGSLNGRFRVESSL